MVVEIDGKLIKNEKDFYIFLAKKVDFGIGYGENFHAFKDRLESDIERPLIVIWKNHQVSKTIMGERFDLIIKTMEDIKKDDEFFMPKGKRFLYMLK